MKYTRLQNYTNMMVDEHGIQTFIVADVVLLVLLLLFDVLSPQLHVPYYFWAISFSKYTQYHIWEEDMYVVTDVCVGDMYYEGKEGFCGGVRSIRRKLRVV